MTAPDLSTQAEALRIAADWVQLGHILGIGTIAVTPAGAVSVHVEPAGTLPEPAARIRALASLWTAATLQEEPAVRLAGGSWARMLRVEIPVPGLLTVTLWAYERVAGPLLGASAA